MPRTGKSKRAPSPPSDDEEIAHNCCQNLLVAMEKLMDKLCNKLTETMSKNFDTKLAAIEKECFDCNQKLEQTQKQLDAEKLKNTKLLEQISSLEKNRTSFETRLDDMEQYSRKDNILIHGLPEQPDEKLAEKVTHLLITKLGLDFSSNDISIAHRLPQRNTSNNKPKPVIVRMMRRSEKDNIMKERRKLKGSGVSITEHLTGPRTQLLQAAQELVSKGALAAAWSSDCRIFASLREGHRTVVTNTSDLQKLTSR